MMLAIEAPVEDSVFEFGFDENVALASPSFSHETATCLCEQTQQGPIHLLESTRILFDA